MLRQSHQQKLLQKLSPQQIQLMKLLQVPTAQLEDRIKEELEENPALETGDEEKPVAHYCESARGKKEEMAKAKAETAGFFNWDMHFQTIRLVA